MKTLFIVFCGFLLLILADCTSQSNRRGRNNTPRSSNGQFTARECSNFTKCGADDSSPRCSSNETCIAGLCGEDGIESGGVCVAIERACQQACGTPECAVLESYPGQISCNNDRQQ